METLAKEFEEDCPQAAEVPGTQVLVGNQLREFYLLGLPSHPACVLAAHTPPSAPTPNLPSTPRWRLVGGTSTCGAGTPHGQQQLLRHGKSSVFTVSPPWSRGKTWRTAQSRGGSFPDKRRVLE